MTDNTNTAQLPFTCDNELNEFKDISISNDNYLNNNGIDECEAADESVTTDSEDYLLPIRCSKLQYSLTSNDSDATIRPTDETDKYSIATGSSSTNNFQIPIVGYEIMEERAKFTVFKLRIENLSSGECWYVFRRYTDFVRLCNKLKHTYPNVIRHLPRKRWLGNNFDTLFLDERANGLQTLVNAILDENKLMDTKLIQNFFCLNDPPLYSDTNEESRAILEALEDTIYQLKHQLMEKDKVIDNLQDAIHNKSIENENLKKVISSATLNCEKCGNESKNIENVVNRQ